MIAMMSSMQTKTMMTTMLQTHHRRRLLLHKTKNDAPLVLSFFVVLYCVFYYSLMAFLELSGWCLCVISYNSPSTVLHGRYYSIDEVGWSMVSSCSGVVFLMAVDKNGII